MEHKIKTFEFVNNYNEVLKAKLFLPIQTKNNYPTVFMLTGDGNKGSNGLSWINLPKLLIQKGIASFVFDFSGLGNSEGERRELTLSKAIEDTKIAFNELKEIKEVDKSNIGILGASFGGNIAVLFASNRNDFKALALKSPVSFYPDSFISEFGQEKMDIWKEKGYDETIDFNYNFYLDALDYSTYKSAKKIKQPCLIIHGNKDEIVPFSQSRHLINSLINSIEPTLVELEGVNHRYSNDGAWDKMAKIFVDFFTKKLN